MSSRTTRIRTVLLALVVGLAATGCGVGFLVTKDVQNSSSTGPFTVSITCQINDGVSSPETHTHDFAGDGGVLLQFDTSMSSTTTCTVTEPANGGALTTTIACAGPGTNITSCTAGAGSVVVQIPATSSPASQGITVTNDFATPPTVPGTPPDPPSDVTATIGSVILSWTPPVNQGTNPITGYVIVQSPGDVVFNAPAGNGVELPCPAPGTYTYTVQAVNASGTSAPSTPSNALTVTSACGAAVAVSAAPTTTG